jgi:hypothetical protein
MNKSEAMLEDLNGLTAHHYANCSLYKQWVDSGVFPNWSSEDYLSIPYLPVRAFKEFDLMSVEASEITQQLTSSGTTGKTSKIFLDQETASAQQLAIRKSLTPYLGDERLPYLVFDVDPRLARKQVYSARLAATLGFSTLGKSPTFIMNLDGSVNNEILGQFLEKFENEKFFAFGFTSVIWQTLSSVDLRNRGRMRNGFLLHGGGWKKLESVSVSQEVFKDEVCQILGMEHIRNYYGMIEQPGSIFIEDETGWLAPTEFSSARIRSVENLSRIAEGEVGVIQVFSTLPRSYPGHSLLTEDQGIYKVSEGVHLIKVLGRLPKSELRGCSDVY